MRPDRDKPRRRPTAAPLRLDRADADLGASSDDGDSGLVDLTPERFRGLIAAASRAESPPATPVRPALPNWAA